jgi:UDP-N-acetylglucosamine--N-acetylmuramyl-(pentapeptide) pyrophosphoryl-undecaprenol N-acetylglucosamine transferase
VPALALAEQLVDAGCEPAAVHLVGTHDGVETRLVPPAGFPLTLLDVRGFRRRPDAAAVRHDLGSAARLARAARQAVALVAALRPRVVVSVGGYASVPASWAAVRAGVPLVTVSYDHVPGLATRLLARRAVASAVAFDDSRLPRAVVTGAPVRRALRTLDRGRTRDAARARLGLPAGGTVLLAVGGSLGSAHLNAVTRGLVARRADDAGLAVLHLAGARHVDAEPPVATPPGGPTYRRLAALDDMADAYAAADLVLARAGASTVAELACVGLPAVLVPWRGAADDHQTANARWLAECGGAEVVPDDDLEAALGVLVALLDDPTRRATLATAARAAGVVHRAGEVGALVYRVARTGWP